MALGKNKSTPESRAFWEFIEKTAAKVRNDQTWQRGAIPPTPPPEEQLSCCLLPNQVSSHKHLA
jgi:hypothetical protein